MREFLALARRAPGTLNYGSAGAGSINHLALELLKARTGVDIVHVPVPRHRRRDEGPARRPDPGDDGVDSRDAAADRRKSASRCSPSRARSASPQLPDVPSWQEEGVADANVINYWGIVAPAGTPPEVIAKLNAEVQKRPRADRRPRAARARRRRECCRGSPERLGAIDRDRSRRLEEADQRRRPEARLAAAIDRARHRAHAGIASTLPITASTTPTTATRVQR